MISLVESLFRAATLRCQTLYPSIQTSRNQWRESICTSSCETAEIGQSLGTMARPSSDGADGIKKPRRDHARCGWMPKAVVRCGKELLATCRSSARLFHLLIKHSPILLLRDKLARRKARGTSISLGVFLVVEMHSNGHLQTQGCQSV